jgi:hypothetical protein
MTVAGGAGSAEPACGFFPAVYELKWRAAAFLPIRVALKTCRLAR